VTGSQVRVDEPSPWVVRFAPLVPAEGAVLDVACGRGRHTRYFLKRGHRVVAIDRDVSWIADLVANPQLEAVQLDLEKGEPFPSRRFEGVVVTNYLHRPLLPDLVGAVASGGVLIYETYAKGHERLGSPSNPDFLLDPGELLEAVRGRLEVIAYEDVAESEPRPAVVQHICAVNTRGGAATRSTSFPQRPRSETTS
jgi:SAM-dependent methyltransferase